MPQDRFQALRRRLAQTDPVELAVGLAALQLLPENADSLPVLEAAAEFVASLQPRAGARSPRERDWRSLIDAFETTCDAFEGLFTHALIAPGVGPVTVIGSRDPSAAFIQTSFLAAFTGGPTLEDERVRVMGPALMRAMLVLSNEISTRAGLRRGMRAVHPKQKRVVIIPAESAFSSLRSVVRFSAEQIRDLLGPQGVDLLLPFARGFGEPLVSEELLAGPLHAHPLLVADGVLIVALPVQILPALAAMLVHIAEDARPLLATRLLAATHEHVLMSLDAMGIDGPPVSEVVDGGAPFLTSTIQLDTDCLLTVHVAVDDLADFDDQELEGHWSTAQDVLDQMELRAASIEASRMELPPDQAPNAFMHLFVFQGVGRAYMAAMDEPPAPLHSPRVVLTAEELEVISALEDDDPLALLKYARAKEVFHEHTRVMSFGGLAEYEMYRANGHNFYLADTPPDFVGVDEGYAEQARLLAYEQRDFHAVPLPDRNGFVLTRLLEDDVRIPLYAPVAPLQGIAATLAEVGGLYCWAVAAIPDHPAGGQVAYNLSHALSYWLWQLEPHAARLYQGAASSGRLVVEVAFEVGSEFDEPSDAPSGDITFEVIANALRLNIPSRFLNALTTPDNSGERAVIEAMLRGLRELAEAKGLAARPSDTTLRRWLDAGAPLGVKKKSVAVDPRRNLELMDHGLPKLRLIQDADFSEVLDDLGVELRRTGMSVGPIADDQRLSVLADAVQWAFAELEARIVTLQPEGLLEWLVGQHEALLSRQAHEYLTTPTRLACYPELAELPRKLADKRQALINTAMATRCVIEAVAARRPRGLRPHSLAVFDRLLALASEGVNRAFGRDALQNGLIDDSMSILESRRLGARREGRFYTGRTAYLEVSGQVEIERASRLFPQHWRSETASQSWKGSAIDAASVAEFGFSLSDLTRLLMEIALIGLNDLPGEAKVLGRAALVDRLAVALEWKREDTDAAIELFVLR
ncbi:MAG: hypothetical protein M3P18_21550, partial [Actinomycetota bacterium]|nr:hypothetical protein [Actinomycetota bacterium]